MPPPPSIPDAPKFKIALTGVQETLMMTVSCKVEDGRLPHPILNDPWAGYVAAQVAYDFSKLQLRPVLWTTIALRARQLDAWTAAFLESHETATVVHLACGLDARAHRVEFRPTVRWIDVDLPNVIELRKKLLPSPQGDYSLVAASVTNEDWLKDIPADRPTAVVFEGLTMYLSPQEGGSLISRSCAHFPSGELIFDCTGWLTLRLQKGVIWLRSTGAKMVWSIDNPKAIEALHKGLMLKDDLINFEMPGIEELPLGMRIRMWIMAILPGFRYLGRNLRYVF
jgi:O-methyltransferase involved in polyketide biosynthesis